MALRMVASGLVDAGVSPAFVAQPGNIGFNATITRVSAGRYTLQLDVPWGPNDINVQVTPAENAAETTATVTRCTGNPTTFQVYTWVAAVATDVDFNVLAVSHL